MGGIFMDSRHESLREGLLNHFIHILNAYIASDTDTLVEDDSLRHAIQSMCHQIYQFFGEAVDVDGILSKHNLLSIDVVLLPLIPDPEPSTLLKKTEFSNFVNEMEMNINQLNDTSLHCIHLKTNLTQVLNDYRNEKKAEEPLPFSPGKSRR
jgi:hypothetical protein